MDYEYIEINENGIIRRKIISVKKDKQVDLEQLLVSELDDLKKRKI